MAGIQAVVAFVETARHGGFARAGRELGLSASAVAKSVARLESDLGVRLLHRTTRQVVLTTDGEALFGRCQRIVGELDALRSAAEGARGVPSGILRLNAPITYGKKMLVPALAEYSRSYPGVDFDLSFSDRYVDVVRDGLDAAVRIGRLADSSLVARRIGVQHLVMLASPRYLDVRGEPRSPRNLRAHDCLLFRMPSTGRIRPLEFRAGRRELSVEPASRYVFDDGEALVNAASAAMGIVQVPDYMAEAEIASGRVIEIMKAYRPAPMPISLVYPSSRHVPPRLRALIEKLCP